MMDEEVFREHVLAWLKALADATIDQARATEALALALQKQGRQGVLRIKIDAPPDAKLRRRRKLKRAGANGQGGA